ncbi:MAG: hypothetical protein PHQ98_03285 [Candidatus ainarchaeum sp.]|nr:hypothetical protein [Candidatus ainarchaeum sp.]
MKSLATLIAFTLALVFFYNKVNGLGLLFLGLAFITFIYDPVKHQAKKGFDELNKASGYYPADKLKSYVKTTSKIAVSELTKVDGTKHNTKPTKIVDALNNTIKELRNVLKL